MQVEVQNTGFKGPNTQKLKIFLNHVPVCPCTDASTFNKNSYDFCSF